MEAKTTGKISKATLVMVSEWAKQQGAALLDKMEKSGAPEALRWDWSKIKGYWQGGFIAGVQAGFQLGFESMKKLEAAKTEEPETIPEQLELPV
jgi:hypothetical protein